MSAELKASRRDATLILTIANPGAKNTLHPDMYAAAIETLSTAERDDSVRAVILTGANNFFCAGSDLHHLHEKHAQDKSLIADNLDHLHGWIEAIRDCPKPVIAAVEGAATGAGFSLALACDFIVAGSAATFNMDYVEAGLTPEGGATWFLTQALPRQLAGEILMTGKPVSATRLYDTGLVNKVVDDGTALDAALAWADELAALPPAAVERIKALVSTAPNHTLVQHIDAERQNFIEVLYRHASREGNL